MHVDSKPIYLGYERDQRKYIFYVIKQGVPRFLSYIKYFFWDKGPQTVLELRALPLEIEQELIKYLEGSLGYEFFKQRRNSKEQSVRKIYRLPEQNSSEQPVELPIGLDDGRTGRTKSGLGSGKPSVPEPSTNLDADAGKRGSRRLRHVDIETCQAIDLEPVKLPVVVDTPKKVSKPPEVALPKEKKPKRVITEVVLEPIASEMPEVIDKNSKMLKALEKLSKPSSVVEVEVPKKLKKVLEPKPLVPIEAEPINRGRPKNASTLENLKEVTPKIKDSGNGNSIRPEVNVEIIKKPKIRKPK